MRIALYPGSFNPIHEGHLDVLEQTHKIFDKVLLVLATNPEKEGLRQETLAKRLAYIRSKIEPFGNLDVTYTNGLLSDFVEDLKKENNDYDIQAVIRGLRNTKDFEDEKTLKYLYQDTGLWVPVIHVISSRTVTHVSSSAIRALDKIYKKPKTQEEAEKRIRNWASLNKKE